MLLFSVWLPSRSFPLFMWIAKGFNSRRLSRLEGGPTIIRAIARLEGTYRVQILYFLFLHLSPLIRTALHIALLIIVNRDYSIDRVFIGTSSFFITTENRNATYGASRGYEAI